VPGALNLVKTRFYVHYKRRMIIDRNETLFATLEDTLAFMLFRRLCLSLATKNAVCTNSWPRD